jgi:transcriptional regulator with XRE-family HTH domain
MKQIDLQKLRKDNKISQKQLAEMLNVPQSFISQIENKKDPMPAYWPQLLIDKLNISDISVYEVEESPQATIVNNQNGTSVFNDLDKFVMLMKSRDELFRDIVKEKDEQINRLLAIIEKMQNS